MTIYQKSGFATDRLYTSGWSLDVVLSGNVLVRSGVYYGSAVTAQASPDMTIQVATGGTLDDNLPVTAPASGGVTIAAADTATTAALTTELGITNAEIAYTAVDEGDDGNTISVEYQDPRAISQSLAVQVNVIEILVLLATDGSGAVTSTAADVISAVNGDSDASALVTAANAPANDGSGVVAEMPPQFLTGGHTAEDRYDVVGLDSTGVLTVVEGTAGVPGPDNLGLLEGVVGFAMVRVPGGGSSITDSEIQDARQLLDVSFTPYRVRDLWYGSIGDQTGSFNYTVAVNNTLYLVPFFTAKAMPVKAIGLRLTNSFVGGCVGRMGVYRDDGAGNLTLLAEAASTIALDITAPASSSTTYVQILDPGWWWLGMALQNFSGAQGSVRGVKALGFSPVGLPDLVSQASGAITVASISGALPDNPTSFAYTLVTAPSIWVQAA